MRACIWRYMYRGRENFRVRPCPWLLIFCARVSSRKRSPVEAAAFFPSIASWSGNCMVWQFRGRRHVQGGPARQVAQPAMAVTKKGEHDGAAEDKGLVEGRGIGAVPKAPGDSAAKPVSGCVGQATSKSAECEVLKEGSVEDRKHDSDNMQGPGDSILVAKQEQGDRKPLDEGAVQLAKQSQNCDDGHLPPVENSEPDCLDGYESSGDTVDNPAYHESGLLPLDMFDIMLLREAFCDEETEDIWDDDSYGECDSLSLEDVDNQMNPEPSNFSSKESDSDELQPEVFAEPSDPSCTESDSDEDGNSETSVSASNEGTSDEMEAAEDWGLSAESEGHGTVSGGPSGSCQCDLTGRYDPLDRERDSFISDLSSDEGADDEFSDEFYSDEFSDDDETGSDDCD